MSEIHPTVDIHDPDNPQAKKTVERSEYREDKHQLWEKQVAEDEEDVEVVGPPMMQELGTTHPDPLPEEPNAAVIEAPGSMAAQMIQRARGQKPVTLVGPQQARAMEETNRAARVRRLAEEAAAESAKMQAERDKEEKAEA